jgi:hypothetical protein
VTTEESRIARELLEREEELTTNAREAFRSWLERGTVLSPKQREWLMSVAVRFGIVDEPAKNVFSAMPPEKQREQRARAERIKLPWELEEKEKENG